MTRATRGPLPWAAVERVYVSTDVPVTQIARISAIPLGVLRDEIKRRGWTRKQSPAALISFETTSALAARLGRLARHQLAMLERQLTRTRPDEHANSRRLSAATALARLIECMAKVENKEPGREADPHMPRVIDDARRLELARRLEGLRPQLEHDRK